METELLVGVTPPGRFEQISFAERRSLLELTADVGLDHVFFADHVSFKNGFGMDGLIQAAAFSQCQPTLGVYVGVYLLALRHPVTVARQISTLCELAPGRLTLGVGVGGEDRHEMEVCGVDPRTRGRRTNECLAIVRALLEGKTLDFKGEFFELQQVVISPSPKPAVPIVIGGRSQAALERTARYGDGWLAAWKTVESFKDGVEAIDRLAAELSRESSFRHGMQVWCGVGDSPESARPWVKERMETMYGLPFERFERYTPCGEPEAIADVLQPYVEAGCKTLNLAMCAESPAAGIQAAGEVKRLLS